MATTAIWKVTSWIGKVIEYADNPIKTVNPDFSGTELQGLRDVMDYATNDFKTEKQYYVTGINCNPGIARQQMILTKKQWGKEDGILAYHAYQSFKPDETDADTAHKIGVEFAEKFWGERFEVIVATHLNTKCFHNHFVLNSVSFADGYKYYDQYATFRELQRVSDELCRKYRLSVIENPQRGKSVHYAQLKAEREGKPTWRSAIWQDIDKAISVSMSYPAFLRNLQKMNYQVDTHGKYTKIRPPGKERFVRLYKLGDNYTEEAIKQRILRQTMPTYPTPLPPPNIKTAKYSGSFTLHRVSIKGLRALYFYFLHKLRQAQSQPEKGWSFSPSRVRVLREELRSLDKISEQTRFLCKYGINDADGITAHQAKAQGVLSELLAERKELCNEKRHVDTSE